MRWVVWIAAGAAGFCVAFVGLTFIPQAPQLPPAWATWIHPLQFAVLIGVFLPAVIGATRAVGKPTGGGLLRLFFTRVPWYQLVLAGIVFFGLHLIASTAMDGLRDGSPELHNGTYMLNNHGQLKQVSQEAFERASSSERRIMFTIPGALFIMAAVMASAAHRTPPDPTEAAQRSIEASNPPTG